MAASDSRGFGDTVSDSTSSREVSEATDSVAQRLEELAAACGRMLGEAVPDPSAARDVARRLGLSTTNAWRIVRLAQDGPTQKVLQSMPGPRAWTAMLSALEGAGTSSTSLDTLRAAVANLQREFDRRGISRAELPRFARDDRGAPAAASIDRRHETRTNALLWGASASGIATSYLVRIDPATGRPRVVGVTTFAGVRRIRPGPEWCLPSPDRVFFADRQAVSLETEPPIEVDASDLLTDEARAEFGRSAEGHIAFRGEHACGTRPIDFAVSAGGLVEIGERVSLRSRPAIFAAPIWIPTTDFVLEVLFERSIGPIGAPETMIYSQIGSGALATVDRHHFAMPGSGSSEGCSMDDRCEELAPPFEAESESGRRLHAALLERAIRAIGLAAGDFVRHRFTLANPVLCTMVELVWPTR